MRNKRSRNLLSRTNGQLKHFKILTFGHRILTINYYRRLLFFFVFCLNKAQHFRLNILFIFRFFFIQNCQNQIAHFPEIVYCLSQM